MGVFRLVLHAETAAAKSSRSIAYDVSFRCFNVWPKR